MYNNCQGRTQSRLEKSHMKSRGGQARKQALLNHLHHESGHTAVKNRITVTREASMPDLSKPLSCKHNNCRDGKYQTTTLYYFFIYHNNHDHDILPPGRGGCLISLLRASGNFEGQKKKELRERIQDYCRLKTVQCYMVARSSRGERLQHH